MRVRVFFTPREAGQHSLEIELTNLNDLRNCPTIGVHAVRPPPQGCAARCVPLRELRCAMRPAVAAAGASPPVPPC
jgi:hypothetical protein